MSEKQAKRWHTGLIGVALGLVLTACGSDQQPSLPPTPPAPAPEPAPMPEPAPVPEALNAFDPAMPVTLALLLPFGTGVAETDALAQSLQNAAELAAEELGGGQITLNTYPTAQEASRAAVIAEAAIQDGAKMLIGPVFSTSVRTVAPVAERTGVPVLSFSNNASVAQEGAWLLGVTFEERAYRLLAHAVQGEMTRIGVIHTTDAEGLVARDALRRAATQTGAEIVVEAFYERSQQGITDAAETYVTLMLESDVDLVVMTDRDSGLIYAASFLPFYGLDTGDQQIGSVQPLGGEIYRIERPLRGAWFAGPSLADLEAFEMRYLEVYEEDPHPLAPLAYEAVVVATTLLRDARAANDMTPFDPNDITRPNGFIGPQGVFRMTQSGLTQRALTPLSVGRSSSVEIGPPLLPPRAITTGS